MGQYPLKESTVVLLQTVYNLCQNLSPDTYPQVSSLGTRCLKWKPALQTVASLLHLLFFSSLVGESRSFAMLAWGLAGDDDWRHLMRAEWAVREPMCSSTTGDWILQYLMYHCGSSSVIQNTIHGISFHWNAYLFISFGGFTCLLVNWRSRTDSNCRPVHWSSLWNCYRHTESSLCYQ